MGSLLSPVYLQYPYWPLSEFGRCCQEAALQPVPSTHEIGASVALRILGFDSRLVRCIQLQGVSATVNMALEWPWPQKALCVEDLLLILDANIGGEEF